MKSGPKYTREEWLARRATPSLGRVQRNLVRIKYSGGTYYNAGRLVKLDGAITRVKKGRNWRKRLVRSTCINRKMWTKVL